MGVRVFVFDEGKAPIASEIHDWIRSQIAQAPKGNWQKPAVSSKTLNSWFNDMRKMFPLIRDADVDDPHGTEYCFYTDVIDIVFAGTVEEEGVRAAWNLAGKHGLRVMVGDELLPRAASAGKPRIHISALDGRKSSRKSGTGPNLCVVVFDPSAVPILRDKRQWVLEQLDLADWKPDPVSIMEPGPLKQWNDEFALLSRGSVITEMKFFRSLVFIRFPKKNFERVLSSVMELSHRLSLPFLVFENL